MKYLFYVPLFISVIFFILGLLGIRFDYNKGLTALSFFVSFLTSYTAGYFQGFPDGVENKHKFNK